MNTHAAPRIRQQDGRQQSLNGMNFIGIIRLTKATIINRWTAIANQQG